MTIRILIGDARERLKDLSDESVHCVVTSPPYFGLRDYGTAQWEGGDLACDHKVGRATRGGLSTKQASNNGSFGDEAARECPHCGARRIDSQIGLEPTPDAYVAELVAVFREVRRVLRSDGTCWLNLGDSYATAGASGPQGKNGDRASRTFTAEAMPARGINVGLKPKDLIGIPWAVATALRDPYYAGRIPKERDRAWLAGIIDGEGSIGGFYHIRADDGRPRTGVHINITNSSTVLLDEAHRIWPASRSEHMIPGEGHYGSREVWRWIVHGTENKTLFVRELYPYLVAKKRQALVAYNLLLLMADAKRLGHSPQRDAVRDKRKFLTDLLSALNQGEVVDLPSWLVAPPSVFEPGWWLRQDIIWHKPNPMPESVRDRCTKSHEYLFLLTKSERYFYDAEAIAEAAICADSGRTSAAKGDLDPGRKRNGSDGTAESFRAITETRNRRSVWTITTQPFAEAHFATFPPELPELCIKAGTSERGCCPTCGKGWVRAVEVTDELRADFKGSRFDAGKTGARDGGDRTQPGERFVKRAAGFSPSCSCPAHEPQPCTVLDPFGGAGTTGLVADRLWRNAILIELNPEYAAMADRRVDAEAGMFGAVTLEAAE